MKPADPTAAERTEVLLQDGLRNGRPVMIPGAFERRAAGPTGPVPAGATLPVTPGAARRAVPQRTMFERIWRYVMRPTDTPSF